MKIRITYLGVVYIRTNVVFLPVKLSNTDHYYDGSYDYKDTDLCEKDIPTNVRYLG